MHLPSIAPFLAAQVICSSREILWSVSSTRPSLRSPLLHIQSLFHSPRTHFHQHHHNNHHLLAQLLLLLHHHHHLILLFLILPLHSILRVLPQDTGGVVLSTETISSSLCCSGSQPLLQVPRRCATRACLTVPLHTQSPSSFWL